MLSQLQQQLQFNIDEQNFVKLTLSKPRQKSSDLKNIYVRLVLIKDQANFSFTYRYKTKDQVKNFEIESGINEVVSMLSKGDSALVILPHHIAHGLTGDSKKIPPLSTVLYFIKILDVNE